MKNNRTCFLALLLALSVSGATQSQEVQAFTADNLGEACQNLVLAIRGIQEVSQEDPGAMLCFGYIAGWSQAMEGVETDAYCWPDDRAIQPGDIAELVVAYAEAHPDDSALPAHQMLLDALAEAFPCQAIESQDSGQGAD